MHRPLLAFVAACNQVKLILLVKLAAYCAYDESSARCPTRKSIWKSSGQFVFMMMWVPEMGVFVSLLDMFCDIQSLWFLVIHSLNVYVWLA